MSAKGHNLQSSLDRRCMMTRCAWRGMVIVVGVLSVGLFLAGCRLVRGEKDQPVRSDASEPTTIVSQGGEVRGHITDADGKPLAEVGVAVPEGTVAIPERAAITNEAGEYVWPLPAGTFTIAVHKEGYVSQSAKVTVRDGETVTLDFVLVRQQ